MGYGNPEESVGAMVGITMAVEIGGVGGEAVVDGGAGRRRRMAGRLCWDGVVRVVGRSFGVEVITGGGFEDAILKLF